MKNTTVNFQCIEPNFGSSASVELTLDKNGTILFVKNTSTNETNWTWDYVPNYFNTAIGNTVDYFETLIEKHNKNLLKGQEYRTPKWIRCN